MMFLFLSFVVPVAGVSLLQVERRPGVVRFGAPMLLEESAAFGAASENDKESVELLRFVTPYKTPLDAVVDITAYSQLMKSLISSGPVEFYVAIDTWVSNDTRSKVLYISNVSDSCTKIWTSQGNAWNVSLDFVQWPRLPAEPVQPKRTILLAESFPNPLLAIGEVKAYEGTLKGDHVTLSSEETLTSANVYSCPSGVDRFKKDATLGSLAQEAQQMVLAQDVINDTVLENITVSLQALYLPEIVNPNMIHSEILKMLPNTQEFEILLSSKANLTKDMPVYITGAVRDKPYTATIWFNMSLPFLPMGYIKEVFNDTHALMNVTKHHCIFSLNSSSLPTLKVPVDEHVIQDTADKLKAILQHGVQRGVQMRASGQHSAGGTLLILNQSHQEVTNVEEVAPLGHITSEASGVENSTGSKVCVVQKNTQGHVITRSFQPQLQAAERALLHLTITGHGWAATSESCGEYCHAVYHLHLNGNNFANVTEWRDDCYLNPGGFAQHGTWYESRNGWCPGSVEPGIYIDITDHLDGLGSNDFTLNLTVWQNLTHRYEHYTDISGFINQDTAMLALTANVLVYSAQAVTAALDLPQAFSKAEEALRNGCSDPERLQPPQVVHFLGDDFTSSEQARQENREQTIDTYPPGAVPFDFETRAPWYFYNESAEILPGKTAGATYLPVIQNRLVQINTRTVFGDVNASKFQADWQQLALRFRLMHPMNLEMDHWDRVGSMGVMIPKTGLQNVQSHTEDGSSASSSKYWRWSTGSI